MVLSSRVMDLFRRLVHFNASSKASIQHLPETASMPTPSHGQYLCGYTNWPPHHSHGQYQSGSTNWSPHHSHSQYQCGYTNWPPHQSWSVSVWLHQLTTTPQSQSVSVWLHQLTTTPVTVSISVATPTDHHTTVSQGESKWREGGRKAGCSGCQKKSKENEWVMYMLLVHDCPSESSKQHNNA